MPRRQRPRRVGQRVERRASISGARAASASRWRATVARVAARDRPGQRARAAPSAAQFSRLARASGAAWRRSTPTEREQPLGERLERDEEVRRDARGGVVERAVGLGDRERLEAGPRGELAGERERVRRRAGDRGAGARAARSGPAPGVSVISGCSEKRSRVRCERVERRARPRSGRRPARRQRRARAARSRRRGRARITTSASGGGGSPRPSGGPARRARRERAAEAAAADDRDARGQVGCRSSARSSSRIGIPVATSGWCCGLRPSRCGDGVAHSVARHADAELGTRRRRAVRALRLSDATASERREALKELLMEARGCTRCAELAATRTTVVFGAGNADADLMFVGEAPGANEDLQGLPFVGAAGKLLETLLGEIGLSRAEVFIANVLKCRPPGQPRPATGRDRELHAVPGPPGRAGPAARDLHARQLRDQAAARRPGRDHAACTAAPRCARSAPTRRACTRSSIRPRRSTRRARSRRCARTSSACPALLALPPRAPRRRRRGAAAPRSRRRARAGGAPRPRRARGRRRAAGAVLSGATRDDGARDRRAGGAPRRPARALAARAARPATSCTCVGELGAGKTTLVRGACRALGVTVAGHEPDLRDRAPLPRAAGGLRRRAPRPLPARRPRARGSRPPRRLPRRRTRSRSSSGRRDGAAELGAAAR